MNTHTELQFGCDHCGQTSLVSRMVWMSHGILVAEGMCFHCRKPITRQFDLFEVIFAAGPDCAMVEAAPESGEDGGWGERRSGG